MSDEETTPFWQAVVRDAASGDGEYQPGDLAAAYLRTDRDDFGDDGDRDDELVSYFDGGQLVVQTFRGELVIAGETVEVER